MRPVYNDELYHFGKKGMKWGKRTTSNIKEGISARNQAGKDQIKHPILSTKAQLSMIRKNPLRTIRGGTEVLKDLNADVKNRVDKSNQVKAEKKANIKSAVQNYSKEHDKSTKMYEAADKQWSVAQDAYKKTGKTKVGAIINNIRNKSPEVKAYNKEFNKASNMSDAADKQWNKTMVAYKKTGKTRLTQIINNIKY